METSGDGPDRPTIEGAAASGDELPAPDEAVVSVPDAAPGDAEALAAAGNEVRLAVLRRLRRAERDGEAPPTFTELFDATDADTTAGFAYHLRQLDGHFVRAVGDGEEERETMDDGATVESGTDAHDDGRRGAGYRLTAAGRRLARALAAGDFTARPSFDPVALGEPCPHCGAGALAAACEDGDVAVACAACGRPVLAAPAPPGAAADAPDELVAAAGRRQRHRLSLLSDGVCPDCGGAVTPTLEEPPAAETAGLPGGERRVRAVASCGACGSVARAPVTHCVVDHPAAVAFYREHGLDLRERPVWNVGEEWRETVLSTDPWCVRVSTAVDGDVLSLFVDGDLEVQATRRPSAS